MGFSRVKAHSNSELNGLLAMKVTTYAQIVTRFLLLSKSIPTTGYRGEGTDCGVCAGKSCQTDLSAISAEHHTISNSCLLSREYTQRLTLNHKINSIEKEEIKTTKQRIIKDL